jgi:lipid II:glycine glycyltransferase (peptidoglycan interpeptide bridge formation enzyme)
MSDAPAVEVGAVTDVAPPGWDALTVDVPGGHVLQSTVWAAQTVEEGWRSRFVTFTDGAGALVLTRRRAPLPGFLAYASRGPVAGEGGARAAAARALALGRWARGAGATILAVDPELDADDAFEATLAAGGFVPAEEIQPSRHRLVVSWAPGTEEDALFAGLSKTTRQRVRSAQRQAVTVREDTAGERLPDLGRFLDATAVRKGFTFSSRHGFLAWWRRLLEARRGRLLVAEAGDRFLGALLMYRQGGHLATAFSADDPAARTAFAGTMQLLRWDAIRLALQGGMPCLDLGGVDVAGARRRPEPGDATWGLYEHKAGFGARWVESAGAHELVLRPAVYRAGLVARSARRALRRR